MCADLTATAAFYQRLGFIEAFRTPPAPAEPIHVDLELDGYRVGLASASSTRNDHGLDPVDAGQRAVVVLWCDDVVAAHRALVDGGAPDLGAPHVWLGRLLIAWVADPDGHAVQIVQRLGPLQHVALTLDWDEASRFGEYRISTRGLTLEQQGFIHLSFPHQLAGVAQAFYRDAGDLVVLEIDPTLLPEGTLAVEPGTGAPDGELFPHLYAPLPVAAVVAVRGADFDETGSFTMADAGD